MKKVSSLICIVLCSLFLCSSACSQRITGGLGMNAIFDGITLGVQGRIANELNDKFKLSGAATYYLKKSASFGFDIDGRYKLLRIGPVAFEPLVGFSITRFGDVGDTSMNLGVYTYVDGERSNIYFEPKFILDSNTVFVLSIGYGFGG